MVKVSMPNEQLSPVSGGSVGDEMLGVTVISEVRIPCLVCYLFLSRSVLPVPS